MTAEISHKRIEYFDLMKGVCIVLVAISHCYESIGVRIGNEHLWSMLEHLRMPLYFFLSGMFFKEYSCFIDFVVRKFNKLVVPFLFFILVTAVLYLACGKLVCNIDAFYHHVTWFLKFWGYMWFLRSLFYANILYYIYVKLVGNRAVAVQLTVLLVFTFLGWYLNTFIPEEIEYRRTHGYLTSGVTALMVMPFFYVASHLKTFLSGLGKVSFAKLGCVFAISLIICYFTAEGGVYLVNGRVQNDAIGFYLASFSAIACVWCVCYAVKRFPYFSYMGRYSIIVYLTHCPLISMNEHVRLINNVYLLVFVILVLMPVAIWFFKTLFPAFVAQKDIFVYENRRIYIDWNAFSLKNR